MTRPPRFFLPQGLELPKEFAPSSANPQLVTLGSDESHHITNVLRMRRGDRIEIFDRSSGTVYLGVLGEEHDGICMAQLENRLPPVSRGRLQLFVALVKSDKCDLIVEKCSEVGADSITFFHAERSQFPLDGSQSIKKSERWTKVAEAAFKQCHGSVLPRVSVLDSLASCLSQPRPAKTHVLQLVLVPPGAGRNAPAELSKIITNFFAAPAAPDELQDLQKNADSYIIVGPEGGLTDSEVSLAAGCDYSPCSLGTNVLRSETAAIVACGMLRAFLR